MKTERTVKALAEMKGRVHVYLPYRAIGTRFIQLAEKEGFTFGDGVKPSHPERGYSLIMGVNHDLTLNYVGIVGRMAFYSGCRKFCGEKYLRVDFAKYINGEKRYLIKM